MRRRNGRTTGAFKRNFFIDNFIAKIVMSSTVNTFKFNYKELLPSLQSTPRAVRIHNVALEFPPSSDANTAPVVQVFFVDPVTNLQVPVNTGLVLSKVNKTRFTLRFPTYFNHYYNSNDLEIAFILQFTYATNDTSTFLMPVRTSYFLPPDPLTVTTPVTTIQNNNPSSSNATDFEILTNELDRLALRTTP